MFIRHFAWFRLVVQLLLWLAKKESQSAARRRWRECEELVTSKWPITNWNKKATIFKLDLLRLRNVWWVVRSSRISCFLSTSIRQLFLIYLWRLSGNLSLLSFLPVQKTNEIIPVSGGHWMDGIVSKVTRGQKCLRHALLLPNVVPMPLAGLMVLIRQ